MNSRNGPTPEEATRLGIKAVRDITKDKKVENLPHCAALIAANWLM